MKYLLFAIPIALIYLLFYIVIEMTMTWYMAGNVMMVIVAVALSFAYAADEVWG